MSDALQRHTNCLTQDKTSVSSTPEPITLSVFQRVCFSTKSQAHRLPESTIRLIPHLLLNPHWRMSLGETFGVADDNYVLDRIEHRSQSFWFKTAILLLHTKVLLLQHDGIHLPDRPPVDAWSHHLIGGNRLARQRLRFSDSPEMHGYITRHGLCTERQAFIGSLLEIVPMSTPRPGQITRPRTRSQRHRSRWHKRHRKRLAKQRRARRKRYTTPVTWWHRLFGSSITGPSTSPISPPPYSTTKYAYTTGKRLVLTTNPANTQCKLLGGGISPPRCCPDEPLWQYYVMHLAEWKQSHTANTETRKIPTQAEFEAMSPSCQYQEFAHIGFSFDSPEELLIQLLPLGEEICQSYKDYDLPPIAIPQLSLQEALCHTRIIHSQLQLLTSQRDRTTREMATLNRERRQGISPPVPPPKGRTGKTYTQLTLELYQLRAAITQHRDTLQQLESRRKSTLKAAKTKLPTTIRIPVGHTPYGMHETTAVVPTSRRRKQWSDVLRYTTPDQKTITQEIQKLNKSPNLVSEQQPTMNPLDAMEKLLSDLRLHGPVLEGAASGQAFDVVGGFKTADCSHSSTLVAGTLNVGGLDDFKLNMAILLMMQSGIDVLVLTDTQHTATSADYHRKVFQARMGGAARIFSSATTPRQHERRQRRSDASIRPTTNTRGRNRTNRVHNGPGGVMFLIGPRWGPSLANGRSDDTGHGALAEIQLRTQDGLLNILGSYWPEKPETSHIQSTAINLWSKISSWLHRRNTRNTSPIQYLQDLALKWTNTALRTGSKGVILTGDLNSRWRSQERGGQRSIENWCDDSFLINGPRLISDLLKIPFFTRGHELDDGTWIDHILHSGDTDHIDILGAFNSRGTEWEGVTDHRPLWAHYSTHQPSTEMPIRPQKLKARVELPLGDKRQIQDFSNRLKTVVSQIPYEGEDSQAAELYLEQLSKFIVDTTEDINNSYSTGTRDSYKDGYSPEFMIKKWHLQAIIEVRRHLLGKKGRNRWCTFQDRQRDLSLIFTTLRNRASGLGLTQHRVDKILNETGKGPSWWINQASLFVDICDAEIRALKANMHGRRRQDIRRKWKARTKWLEGLQEKGKARQIIKQVLKANAGRKHTTGLNLDTVRDTNGRIYVTPQSVHRTSTDHFREWYDMPADYVPTLHTVPDWRPHLQSYELFIAQFPNTQVPTHLSEKIYHALQDVPQAAAIRQQLTQELASAPSIEESTDRISQLKRNSSPGMSGLSYNMLRKAPKVVIQEMHKCLAQFWEDKHIPSSWKWRWLVPIPKKPTDAPTLEELRPLMLCEALRKVWSALVISKIQNALHQHKALDPAQHGYLFGRSTGTASMIHINGIEDAEELDHELHRSSYDLKKAFDTTSKPLMLLAWQRLGVPLEIAHWLTEMDVGGTTVVKTPFAQYMWQILKYHTVDTAGTYPPGHLPTTDDSTLLEAFDAIRGTGQGDVTSPTCWIAVMDILLTALRQHDQHATGTRYRGDRAHMYISEETSYADDLESICATPQELQSKADIVSAFCILAGLQLSHGKLRRVMQAHIPKDTPATPLVVHVLPWTPKSVTVNTTEATEYLGGIYDVVNNGKSTLKMIRETAQQHCNAIIHSSVPAASKLMVATASTLAKVRYKAALSVLSLSELRGVDKLFSNLFRDATRNMVGFPTALIHLAKKYGGLGIKRFSDEVQIDKLSKIFTALRSTSLHAQATAGILNRAARQSGLNPLPGQPVIIHPNPVTRKKQQRLFTDSLVQWLGEGGLRLCRHGSIGSTSLQTPISALPNIPHALVEHCASLSIHILGDLLHQDPKSGLQWYTLAPFEELTQYLPTVIHGEHTPLQIGQYWKLETNIDENLRTGNVVRINGHSEDGISVTQWIVPDPAKPNYAITHHKHYTVSHDKLFPGQFATRVTLQKNKVYGYLIREKRKQPTPHWPLPTLAEAPHWARWMLEAQRGNSFSQPRLYTDGAYSTSSSVLATFRPSHTRRHSSASIILKDDSPNWKSKTVHIVHINDGNSIQAESAYTMEYIALAAAMKLQSMGCTANPIGSDANSIISMLPHRKQRLRQVCNDHILPLQCIDDAIHQGCPLPEHVQSHPEKRKPGNKSNWTAEDWGNYIADRAAAADYETLRDNGIKVHVLEVSAATIYNDLRTPEQWYIGLEDGTPVAPRGALTQMQDKRFAEYLQDRDNYRAKRQEPAFWHDNSLQFVSRVFQLHTAPNATLAAKCRLIYDKHWHGRNRQKDTTLSEEDRIMTGQCVLCQQQDSQEHTFACCQDKLMVSLRDEITTNLRKHVHQYDKDSRDSRQIGRAFMELLAETSEPGRMWIGNLSDQQITRLTELIPPNATRHMTQAQLDHILLPICRILADGSLNLNHQKVIADQNHELAQHVSDKSTTKSRSSAREPHHPMRNPQGRKLHRSLPTAVALNASPTPNLRLEDITRATQHKLDSACQPNNASRTFATIHGAPISGSHLHRLQTNQQIHDVLVGAYLHLLADTNPEAIRAFDTQFTYKLLNDSHARIDRMFRMRTGTFGKGILEYDSLLIPVQKPGHFVLVVAQPRLHTIKVYDSLRPDYNVDNEIAALQRYLVHAAGDCAEHHIWNIDRVAANDMLKQQGGVHCGVYTCMMAHCLMAGLPITLLTPDNIASCRQHMAQCLLNNRVTLLTQHNVVLSTGNGPATPHLEESKGDDDDHHHLIQRDDDDIPVSLLDQNPAYQSYPILNPSYSWTPSERQTVPHTTHTLRPPRLAPFEYDELLRQSNMSQPDIQLYNTIAPRDDFLKLLQADELPASIVNVLFQAGLDSISDVVFFPAEVTHEFTTGIHHRYQQLNDSDVLQSIRHSLFNVPRAVFLFGSGRHYTVVFTDRNKKQILFADSIMTQPTDTPWQVHMIRELFQDEAVRQGIVHSTDDWTVHYPTTKMAKQQTYRSQHQHPSAAQHIDCGLYALLSTLLLVSDYPLDILTPSSVHAVRPHLAHFLSTSSRPLDVRAWLFRSRLPPQSPSVSEPPLQPAQFSKSKPPSEPLPDSERMASLRPRRSVESKAPPSLPARIPHAVHISDPTRRHTYVAKSTIPGADNGLFTSRYFDGNDNDDALIGEYYGGEQLTKAQIYTPGYHSDYTIEFGSLIRDAWSPQLRKVLCMVGYINDPLDEDMENCMWLEEKGRLYVTIKTGHHVAQNAELFTSYGEQHWCSTKFDFPTLQRAVWRYRNYIKFQSTDCRWPLHPLAHELFNTPLDGRLPFSFNSCPCWRCTGRQPFEAPPEDPPLYVPSIVPTPIPPTVPTASTPSITTLTGRKRHSSPRSITSNKRVSTDIPSITDYFATNSTVPSNPRAPTGMAPVTKHTAKQKKKKSKPRPSHSPTDHTIHSHFQRALNPSIDPPSTKPPESKPRSKHKTKPQQTIQRSKPLKPRSTTDLDLHALAALVDIDLDSHIRSQLYNGRHLNTNHHFTKQVFIADSDIPGAGKGLFAITNIPRFTVIGIYTGGEGLTAATVSNPSYQSDYVVTYGDQVRDALDHKTHQPTCDVAYINDALDPDRQNTDWYTHPEFPDKILVISTTDIPADAQLFIPYGAEYWCQDKFPITILAAAIRCYNIDIHSSPQWSRLQAYSHLCTLFPKPLPLSTAFDTTVILSDYTPTTAEQRLFARICSSTCPSAVHSKPDLESSRSIKHHRQAYHQLIAHCRNNRRLHALYLQSGHLDHSHLRHLADVLPTTNIYAINLGEADFSAASLQFLHDFLPTTSITQIYLHQNPHAHLLRNIQLRADQNRPKVHALYTKRGIIPAEWGLISKQRETTIEYTDGYVSSQSTTSTDHLDPHPPPSQDLDIAPNRPVTSPSSPTRYDPTWNRYQRNSRLPATSPTYSIAATSVPSERLRQFRQLHNQFFPSLPLWSQDGAARAADPSSHSSRKRKRLESPEDATSPTPPDNSLSTMSAVSMFVCPSSPSSLHQKGLEPSSRIDSSNDLRSVRARLSTAIFDNAMFRNIFSSRILSEPHGPNDLSPDFCFSFSFDFAAAPISTSTTLNYDKHIVDS